MRANLNIEELSIDFLIDHLNNHDETYDEEEPVNKNNNYVLGTAGTLQGKPLCKKQNLISMSWKKENLINPPDKYKFSKRTERPENVVKLSTPPRFLIISLVKM